MLRSVDVQQLFLQSTAVEKVQQLQHQHPEMQQKYLAMQLTEERRLSQEQVATAEEAKRTMLRDREERRRRKQAEADQHPPRELSSREETAGPDPDEQGDHIDIRV
ncbi:MAG: hypothetical protein ACYC7J_07765 [Syntrophales bacterium]